MSDLKKNFIKDITSVLLGCVPGGNILKSTISSEIANQFTKEEIDIVKHTAQTIFENLYNSVGLDSSNPGAAKAAAYNILSTIQSASITAQVLVDCCLDPHMLYNYLLKFPAPDIEHAGGIRQSLYYSGLQQFSRDITQMSLRIRHIQWLSQRQVLINQKQILDAIHNLSQQPNNLNDKKATT